MAKRLSEAVSSWTFRVALLVLWTAAVQSLFWSRLYYTGDEPHYLMSAISFLEDGDFNLYNNFMRGDQRKIGYPELAPQYWFLEVRENPTLVPAEHGTVFPILIAYPYKWLGIPGLRVLLILCGVLGCLTAARALDLLGFNRMTGTLGLALLVFSPTWQMQASRIYPETFAALLSTIAVVLLASQRRSWLPLFAVGFLIAFLPVMYVKYIAVAASVGITALFLPEVRRHPAFWLGGGAAFLSGVWNVSLWGDQGALGGLYQHRASHLYAVSGFFDRYWKQFFDRHHGVVPYQPWTILTVWAFVTLLRPPQTRKQTLLSGLALAGLFHTGMLGIFTPGPGFSMPGRYLVAVMPVMAICVAIWATRRDSFAAVRLSAVALGVGMAVAVFVASFVQNLPPYFAMQTWRALWPRYWDSWELNSAKEVIPVGWVGYYVVAAILVSKCVVYWWFRRRAIPTEEPLFAPQVSFAQVPRTSRTSAKRRR